MKRKKKRKKPRRKKHHFATGSAMNIDRRQSPERRAGEAYDREVEARRGF
jgi:hypothetical protein